MSFKGQFYFMIALAAAVLLTIARFWIRALKAHLENVAPLKSTNLRILKLSAAALLTLSCCCPAQVADISTEGQDGATSIFTVPRQFLRTLDERGISFQETLIYDWSMELPRDADSRAGFGRSSFDISMALDGRKALGLEGSSGFVRLKQHWNQFGEANDGAAQIFSNIDAASRTTLYEAWLEQRLFSNRLRLKAGKIDANTEFAAVQNAGDFLNSSMGFSPTIVAFPTYPEPKFGINAFLNPAPKYGVGLGVFQTAGMGTLAIVEPGANWNAGSGERPGRMSLGYWRLNRPLPRFDGGYQSGSQGFYSVLEQAGWPHPWVGDHGERRLSTFFQIGSTENQINAMTRHIGGGGILQQPFRQRPHDSIGMAVTWVRFSSAPQAAFDWSGELVFEGYYRATLNQHLALVQDFQRLHHPGGLEAQPDCSVVTPRLVVTF